MNGSPEAGSGAAKAAVHSALQASNEEFSTQSGGVLAGWNDLQVPPRLHCQV